MVFKLVLMSLCGVLLSLKASAAQEYQRKQVMPEFFIPQQALPKPEKLPPIKFSTLAPQDEAVKKVSLQEQKTTPQTQQTATPPEDLEVMPQYKQKYDEYIEDLEYIGDTGEYPNNQGLRNDLAKMDSDEKFYIE